MEPSEYYQICLQLLNPAAVTAWPAIKKAYEGRAYHNLNHLQEMIGHFPKNAPFRLPESRQAAIFGIALIYHDIIYQAGRKDNEKCSADRAEAALLLAGASTAETDYCRSLIMATKTHQPDGPEANDQCLLIDLDLAVLARTPEGYDIYARAVRQEFSWFPDFLYRPGRKKALQHFLEQDFIYYTPMFREGYEDRARANLKREMTLL
ncbi:hypothetical protein [Neolewinella agarilytica]|uniref:HD domain-containing protein n=1 Tax=Neolewinella agarilytica TaxID=478744 RepID=UPI0023569249|nr:hypothetical protein [Neolewinella agarilytica]